MNQTNKIGTFITNAYKVIVAGLFSAIMAFLVYATFLFTVRVNMMEKVYFLKDAWWIKLGVFALIVGLSVFFSKIGLRAKIDTFLDSRKYVYSLIRCGLCLLLFVILLIFVKKTLFFAWADAGECIDAARKLLLGDFSPFNSEGYVNRYPMQSGLIGVEYLFMKVVGITSILPFQVVNAACIALIYFALSDVVLLWNGKKSTSLCVLLFGFLFLPLLLYVSFAYGNIPGLALSLLALDFWMRYFQKKKVIFGLLSAVFISAAVMLKSNFWIFLIAMVLYGIVKSSALKKWLMLWPVVLMIAFGFLLPKGALYCIERLSHEDLSSGGETLYAWVVMGLSETPNYPPGWFNEYNQYLYFATEHNMEEQTRIAKEDLAAAINGYRSDWPEFHSFMVRKMISQWAEPTYESFWLLRGSNEVLLSDFMDAFIRDPSYAKVAKWFDAIPWLLYAGALLGVLLAKREGILEKLLPALCFVGGFLFHTFWEAKSQYALLFVVLLIPLAIEGYRLLGEWIAAFAGNFKFTVTKKKLCYFAWVGIVIAFLIYLNVIGSFNKVGHDNAAFETYITTTDFYE